MAKERGVAFTEKDFQRTGRAVRRVESMPPRQPGTDTDTQIAIPITLGRSCAAIAPDGSGDFNQLSWGSGKYNLTGTPLEIVRDFFGTGCTDATDALIFRTQRDGQLHFLANPLDTMGNYLSSNGDGSTDVYARIDAWLSTDGIGTGSTTIYRNIDAWLSTNLTGTGSTTLFAAIRVSGPSLSASSGLYKHTQPGPLTAAATDSTYIFDVTCGIATDGSGHVKGAWNNVGTWISPWGIAAPSGGAP